jgi:uncharacterized membrane protein YcaP (DUF421 family)
METILRAILTYAVLFIIFRVAGKRTLQESSPFGFILLFLISSSVADALKDDDRSITNGFLLAFTLISIHYILTRFKRKNKSAEKIIDDIPQLLGSNGELFDERMDQTRVTRADILAAARQQKITRLENIKYVILEVNGNICVIPKE